jgi:hypothetical protein
VKGKWKMSNNPFSSVATIGIVRSWDEFSGSDFLKSDNSGNWSKDNAPADAGPYLPVNYRFVLQHWQNGRVIDTKDADLFDLDELNAEVPKERWEPGYNKGELRPPWQRAKQLIFMNLRSGEQVIYSASNIRCIKAVTQLIDQVRSKNFFFGRTASPVVELGSAPFNTDYGMQKRGDFKVLDRPWFDLSGSQALPDSSPKQLLAPTLAQELGDQIPDFGAKDDAPFVLEADATPVTPPPAAKGKARR